MYTVVRQASGTTQGLVAAKVRLAKQGLTIPKLELMAGYMAVNLVDNVRRALAGFLVVSVHYWLDSTVALYWICGGGDSPPPQIQYKATVGEYRQFVANRVQKIRACEVDEWRHVPSGQNPRQILEAARGRSILHFGGMVRNGCNITTRGHQPLSRLGAQSPEQKLSFVR